MKKQEPNRVVNKPIKKVVVAGKPSQKQQVAKKSISKKPVRQITAKKPMKKQQAVKKPVKKQPMTKKPIVKSVPTKKPAQKKQVAKLPIKKKQVATAAKAISKRLVTVTAKPQVKKPVTATAKPPIKKPAILSLTKPKSVMKPKKAAVIDQPNIYRWTSDLAGSTMDFVVAAKTPVDALSYAGIPREKAWYLDECIDSKLRAMAMNKPGTVFVRDLSLHYYEEWKGLPGYSPKASSNYRDSKTED